MSRLLSFKFIDSDEYSFGEHQEYTHRYLATVDEPSTAEIAIRVAKPELQRYQPHPRNPRAVVDAMDIKQRKHSATLFDVEVKWTSSLTDIDDPLAHPARIDFESTEKTVATIVDGHGKVVRNSAGDIVEPVEVQVETWIYKVTKNIGSHPTWLDRYQDVVNNDALRIRGRTLKKHTLKIKRLKIADKTSAIDYHVATFELHIRPDRWHQYLVQRGTNELVEVEQPVFSLPPTVVQTGTRSVVERQACVDREGKPEKEPAFLDADGRRPRFADNTSVTEEKRGNPKQWFGALDPQDILVDRVLREVDLPFSVLRPLLT